MSNALEWRATIRDEGYVLDPTGPGRYAPIDPADIGAVAARILTEHGHQGQQYVLTGDEMFTVAEQVAVLAKAIGRNIEVREVATPAEVIRSRYPNGAPPALADALLDALTRARADTVGFRTDTVQQLLARKPGTFEDWCARNAATFPISEQRIDSTCTEPDRCEDCSKIGVSGPTRRGEFRRDGHGQ